MGKVANLKYNTNVYFHCDISEAILSMSVCLGDGSFCYASQPSLQLLGSGNPASVSQEARKTGIVPSLLIFRNFVFSFEHCKLDWPGIYCLTWASLALMAVFLPFPAC